MPRQGGPEPEAFELANVPVYTLNVSGLVVDTSQMASGRIGVPLGLMDGANETGGQSYYRTNDLTPAVGDILGENDSVLPRGVSHVAPDARRKVSASRGEGHAARRLRGAHTGGLPAARARA